MVYHLNQSSVVNEKLKVKQKKKKKITDQINSVARIKNSRFIKNELKHSCIWCVHVSPKTTSIKVRDYKVLKRVW